MKIKITTFMEIEDDFLDAAKRWEHHVENLMDLDNNPEIKSVYGVQVTPVSDTE